MTEIEKLHAKLAKVEAQLEKCRTSTMQDGWQTQKHAKKSRKWDFLAQEKMEILEQIYELEKNNLI